MCGGLGLRDFSCLNAAFNLKCLWKIAADSSALWVRVAKAKYLKDESFWLSTRRTRCTALWRAIMDARSTIQQHVNWQLGDGTLCRAFGQPWHDLWHLIKPASLNQNHIVVSELLNVEGGWDTSKLIQVFGFATALFISISVKPPQSNPRREDRLIFTYAKNGKFSLRKAYLLLAPASPSPTFNQKLLKALWQTQGLLPRVRIFLWKTMHNSLPLGDILGRRIANVPRPCSLCGYTAETITHALFKCPWARTLWLSSEFGLRTDELDDNVTALLMTIFGEPEENRTRLMANHLWALWKLRCKEVYEAKKTTPLQFLTLANSYEKLAILSGTTPGSDGCTISQQVQVGSITCAVDGSFLLPDSAGWAYLLSDGGGRMIEYGLQAGLLSSPLHAEIMAMLGATTAASKKGIQDCIFYTDCANLNLVINGSLQADQLDWRVYHDLLSVIHIFRTNPGYSCAHTFVSTVLSPFPLLFINLSSRAPSPSHSHSPPPKPLLLFLLSLATVTSPLSFTLSRSDPYSTLLSVTYLLHPSSQIRTIRAPPHYSPPPFPFLNLSSTHGQSQTPPLFPLSETLASSTASHTHSTFSLLILVATAIGSGNGDDWRLIGGKATLVATGEV
ncbi:Ribonuclease H-like superfamily protein [Rhynchospora pubera]|uniref:Ribonuclease H-like superfamily protein n=1 Tax=Rhynchospora pubera TaxID=906938 RepID=A0AAV8HT50_9POAL|nr:Ribonuclease H-like superfamily protein [Rhynchospora pubera]